MAQAASISIESEARSDALLDVARDETIVLLTQATWLVPLALAQSHLASASVESLWPLLALLIAITFASNLTGSILQRVAGAAAYSQIGYVIALTGVVASALMFDEAPGALFWPALALVFAGIVITNRPAPAIQPPHGPAVGAALSPQR